MRNFGCSAVGGVEWDEVEEEEKKMLEWEREAQGKLGCSACSQEGRRGFAIVACTAQGDWMVLPRGRLPM